MDVVVIVSPSALPKYLRRRVEGCGADYYAWRQSGRHHEAEWRCGSQWCEHCAEKRASKIYARIMTVLESSGLDSESELYMVTLTARTPPGLGALDLRWRLDRDQKQWRHVTSRLQWQHRYERLSAEGVEQRAELRRHGIRPARWTDSTDEAAAPAESEYLGDGQWRRAPGRAGDRRYIWALEMTTGRRGDRWHLHRHVLTDDLALAQQIAGAWDSFDDSIQGNDPYVTSIHPLRARWAAGYFAGYVTGRKPGGWWDTLDGLTPAAQSVVVREMSGRRRYDAAGDWRPLGIGCAPSDDPLVAVHYGGGICDPQTAIARNVLEWAPIVADRCAYDGDPEVTEAILWVDGRAETPEGSTLDTAAVRAFCKATGTAPLDGARGLGVTVQTEGEDCATSSDGPSRLCIQQSLCARGEMPRLSYSGEQCRPPPDDSCAVPRPTGWGVDLDVEALRALATPLVYHVPAPTGRRRVEVYRRWNLPL